MPDKESAEGRHGSVEMSSDDASSSYSSARRSRRKKRKREKHRRKDKKRKDKKKKQRRHRRDRSPSSSSSSDSDSERSGDRKRSSSSSAAKNDNDRHEHPTSTSKLLAKLQARGETLEERLHRRAERATQKRAAQIAAITGYTAEDNPFQDPNLHQPFTWKKKVQQTDKVAKSSSTSGVTSGNSKPADAKTLHEIEKLRKRRTERELQMEEMDRIKREEARMKELENFDEWARKEEAFHLQQQRQRSAIRLVQGREKPIDILAKNLLLFGLTEEEKSLRGAAVKYQETTNALTELENFQAELEVPFAMLRKLKLEELEEVLKEIDAFLALERQVLDQESAPTSTVMKYWEGLRVVTVDEMKMIQTGGPQGSHAVQSRETAKIFEGQSTADLRQMQSEIRAKLSRPDDNVDREYWSFVQEQLTVHLTKAELSSLHQKMLVRQLEKLEQKRAELAQVETEDGNKPEEEETNASLIPANAVGDEGDAEEEFGGTNEVEASKPLSSYSWADKYRPRKPRYFNRVKTGYDWNKYNKTHYDRDNPPPKTVQGYKFNIFYPDLIDPSKTPQFVLEPADSSDFCIIRFKAGPPYEDVAFKIVNREWNKSRKHGFRCTFERGVLSLYVNFKGRRYRR